MAAEHHTTGSEELMPDDVLFRLEVIKLLLQVAWADHRVSADEREMIHSLARRLDFPEEDLELLDLYLRGDAPLPAPNMALLRRRREETLFHVKAMIRADLKIDTEEHALVSEIEAQLR